MTEPIKIISAEKLKEKPDQEFVWDNIAAPWKTYVVKKIPIVVEFLKENIEILTEKNNSIIKICDLGCGNGRNMIPLKHTEYYGIDFSLGQLKHAKETIKKDKINAKLFKGSVANLPEDFKTNMFDVGLFISTLHCIIKNKDRKKALKEFYRILKPGAEGLISIWNSDDKRFKGLKGDIYMSWKEDGVPYMRYYHLYTKQEFINFIKSVGFEILKIYEPREHDRFSKKNLIIKIKKKIIPET